MGLEWSGRLFGGNVSVDDEGHITYDNTGENTISNDPQGNTGSSRNGGSSPQVSGRGFTGLSKVLERRIMIWSGISLGGVAVYKLFLKGALK